MLPYVMATVLAKEERLSEVLDVGMLYALVTNNTNLHLLVTFVDVELALVGHVAVGCR
jgi:hypothetical protein